MSKAKTKTKGRGEVASRVPQGVMEDAIAVWNRLRRWGNANDYLIALSNPYLQRQWHNSTIWDPYSIRLVRRVAEVVERLDSHKETCKELGTTPRGKLLALAGVVRQCLESFDPLRDSLVQGAAFPFKTPLSFQSPPSNVDWTTAVDKRTVGGAMIMEGLHILTCPSVQLRLETWIDQLLRHLAGEINGGSKRSMTHSPKEIRALQATTMLLEDFDALYKRILCVFPCARVMGSAHVPVALLPIIIQLYYKLADWVRDAEVTGELNGFAQVVSFDKSGPSVNMHRKDIDAPWGLQFNDEGRVVQVNPSVRSGSRAAQKLHTVAQYFKRGLSILLLNGHPISFENLTAKQAADKLHFWTMGEHHMVLEMQESGDTLPLLEQLAFYVVPRVRDSFGAQSDTGGPCATLVLHRELCGVPWDIHVTAELRIVDVPGRVLSSEAAAFFKTHARKLRIGAINGVEVTRAYQVEALTEFVHTIVLDLYEIPPQELLTAPGKPKQPNAGEGGTDKKKSEPTSRGRVKGGTAYGSTDRREAHRLQGMPTLAGRVWDSSSPGSAVGKPSCTNAIVLAEEPPVIVVSTVAERIKNAAAAMKVSKQSGGYALTDGTKRKMAIENNESGSVIERNETRSSHAGDVATSPIDAVMMSGVESATPLIFPNNVIIDRLTTDEMVVQRPSCEKKWGLCLETEGMYPRKAIYLAGLPGMLDEQRHHPFSKLFRSRKGKWRIASVNGTPASKLPELVDVMKHALRVQIKFFRRW